MTAQPASLHGTLIAVATKNAARRWHRVLVVYWAGAAVRALDFLLTRMRERDRRMSSTAMTMVTVSVAQMPKLTRGAATLRIAASLRLISHSRATATPPCSTASSSTLRIGTRR
jgi:hypothetical protein